MNYLIRRHKSLLFLIVVDTTIQIELYRLTNPALSHGIKLENAFWSVQTCDYLELYTISC